MKKGITVSILAVTIVIMITIASAATVIGVKSINTAAYEEFLGKISRVSSSVNEYVLENNSLPITQEIVAKAGLQSSLIAEINAKNDADNKLFVVDMKKLQVESVNIGSGSISDMDIFVVAENTNNVYYLKGITYNGTIYYGIPLENISSSSKNYSITQNLTNALASVENVANINTQEIVTLIYSASNGYDLPEKVTVTGASKVWERQIGKLTLYNPTENINITVEGTVTIPSDWNSRAISTIVDNVPIPKGFVASPYSDENTKTGGLVIYELNTGETEIPETETQFVSWTTRNQYVWVPVENFTTEFVRTPYNIASANRYLSNALGEGSGYWEATLDLATNLPHATQNLKYMSSTTLAEVQAMYASVKKYGGFYVARYEMGIDTQRTSNTSISGITVHSKMNKIPFTYLQWSSSSTMNIDTGGAVEVARGIYPVSNTRYGVVSTLIYDVQWDTTINWIANTKLADGITAKYPDILVDSTNYGNYRNHAIASKNELNVGASYAVYDSDLGSYTQVASESTIVKNVPTKWALTTGALKVAKTNNIYDMAGNMREWSMSGCGTSRACRGGDFLYTGIYDPIFYRSDYYAPTSAIDCISSRVALYIK